MTQIDFLGTNSSFLGDAFFDSNDSLDSVEVISPRNQVTTQVVLENSDTGIFTTITGTNLLVNSAGDPVQGTITGFSFSQNNVVQATISGISWPITTLLQSLLSIEANNDLSGLAALFNGDGPITFDASGASGFGYDMLEIQDLLELITQPITAIGTSGADTLLGGQGNDSLDGGLGTDVLFGFDGDDTINPGDNNGNGDTIFSSAGNDTFDLSDIVDGWVPLDYTFSTSPITAAINGLNNTGSINAGAGGTDTIIDVINPLASGWTTGGLRINGTNGADTFNVTLGDEQWMDIVGENGNDTFNLNFTGTGYARLSYIFSNGAVTADLTAGTITQDGFTDQLNLTSTGDNAYDIDLRTSTGNDSILGSGFDETFIVQGGNDTVDGGGGVDRIRYDRNGYDAVSVNLTTGTATGTYFGGLFTDTLSNIEVVRGSSNGNDTLLGSAADEGFHGRGGNDGIAGGAGSDVLLGEGGNDTLDGGAGDDGMIGGAGTDTAVLATSQSSVVITQTNAGFTFNGYTYGSSGLVIRGSDGVDFISDDVEFIQFSDGTLTYAQLESMAGITDFGTAGADTLNGGANGDFLVGFGGNDTLNGNGGNDSLLGGTGFDSILGGDGNDTLLGEGQADLLRGGNDQDHLDGGDGADQIYGDAGNDTLLGGSGADRLFGGDGNDWIDAGFNFGTSVDGVEGGAGNDTIFGGVGFDLLQGGTGDDELHGGAQADNLYGEDGNDTLNGEGGFDRLFGGAGDDLLEDYEGFGSQFGGSGNDTMRGGNDGTTFYGQAGDDLIEAGGGDDRIGANAGFDTIDGGAGNDLMFGDFNADTFVFQDGHGVDTVGDFDALNALEKIDLQAVTSITSLADLNLGSATSGAATQAGANVQIDTGNGNLIILNGVSLSDLDASDFIF